MARRHFLDAGEVALVTAIIAFVVAGCGGDGLSGGVHIDGSSTVYPITEAIVEQFQSESPEIRVAVGVSGTGGGFKKFCAGEAEIADASRRIKESELERCRVNGVKPVEFQIALDGLSVLVNPTNDFVGCLTVDELKRIWEPGSAVERWSQVRQEWPDEEIVLYGPGVDSGSFDYFTENIVGEEDASRSDYTASEDDNVLVHGISGDRWALGYFGYAYYAESPEMLKLVAVDAGAGCVLPTPETIRTGEYRPLTRPLMVYADSSSLEREEITAFLRYYFSHVEALAADVGYVPLPADRYEALLKETG
jgi:phosphate transport system substrate-binding protein